MTHLDCKSTTIDADQLFRAHSKYVAGFLKRHGVAESLVDDSVQEVFLVVHNKGGYVPGRASPRTWLCSIAIRIALNARRAYRRRNGFSLDDSNVPSDISLSDALMEYRQDLDRVQQVLSGMDGHLRDPFLMFVNGQNCKDISNTLGIPEGTVYSRLHTARGNLNKGYADLVEA